MVEFWCSLSYGDKVALIIFILAAILFLFDFLFLLRWFYLLVKQIKRKRQQVRRTSEKSDAFEIATVMVSSLVNDPDPLSELIRYARLAEAGKVSRDKGPEVVRIFFEELSGRWKLCEIGPFDSVVRFDSRQHTSAIPIDDGDLVRVIRPGWRLGERVVKPATVMPERR